MLEGVFVVGSLGLVEIVHVQLSDKGSEVVVLEKSGQNCLRKLVKFLDNKGFSICRP